MCATLTEGNAQLQDQMINDDEPCLGTYLNIFLKNTKVAKALDDKRILFYRGQSDSSYLLTPSVFRNGLLTKEHILISDIVLNSPSEFNAIGNSFERLIKMQHYGLPTRLLDITLNPLVALYFACSKDPESDGEVLIFYDYIQRPYDINVRSLVALAEYSGSSERKMLGFLSDREIKSPELGYLTTVSHVLIEAPMNNERIKRQQGAFIIVGIRGDQSSNPFQKTEFDLKPLLVKDFDDGIGRSIIIPKDEKAKLLLELETFGINHGFLFPELEHQAAYIKNKYEGG
ncbi:FRG domain-containing protein [Paenibacillus tritici]|uniref:FRG domain-containing protein n=1 Tax=Paenibacillus tritici TaxID=1873425 RepID=A0ABX2DW92_9BACL|nr:FRG domain-containing protein [Paenibacillus tritici]NQX48379.1 FRG domain-containing protein [Paenibacillus tritici]